MDINLVRVKKNGSKRSFALTGGLTTIGRSPDCDLYIPLISVSRKHCQLRHNKEILKIQDLDSRNGTTVNGTLMQESKLQPGDCITVGPLTFVLQIDGQPQNPSFPQQAPTAIDHDAKQPTAPIEQSQPETPKDDFPIKDFDEFEEPDGLVEFAEPDDIDSEPDSEDLLGPLDEEDPEAL